MRLLADSSVFSLIRPVSCGRFYAAEPKSAIHRDSGLIEILEILVIPA
jgi:hypothetical protein